MLLIGGFAFVTGKAVDHAFLEADSSISQGHAASLQVGLGGVVPLFASRFLRV